MRVAVYFATWCPCCTMLMLTVEEMRRRGELDGWSFDQIDVDTAADATRAAGIRAVPTIVIERDDERTLLIGAISRAKLLAELAA